jgi:large subunit ribosomal protein L25
MHKEAKLVGTVRSKLGSLECRRLRKSGRTPGNLYGHGQTPLPFSVQEDAISPVVHEGIRVVDIDVDGSVSKAIVREVQWDTFGTYIKHFDLLRIDADEKLTIEVPLEIRGIAPGTLAGGVLEFGLRHLTVECLAYVIPDHIPIKVGDLQLNQSIHVRDIEALPNVTILDDPEAVIVRVVHITGEALPGEGAEGPAQPELIGRKPAEGEEEES